MIIDGFYPFMYKSTAVNAYHQYLISTLPKDEIEPEQIPVLLAKDATKDSLKKIMNGYNSAVIVKGALNNVSALRLWSNRSFWMENYGDEEVMVKMQNQTFDNNYNISWHSFRRNILLFILVWI